MNILVKDLPKHIGSALKGLGFGSNATVKIKTQADPITRASPAFTKGDRGLCILFGKGEPSVLLGNYGGPNPFVKTQAICDCDPADPFTIEQGKPVFKGWAGYRRGGTLLCHPEDFEEWAPSSEQVALSSKAWKALEILRTKSGYRKDEFVRRRLGMYGAGNPYIQELVSAGFAKTNKRGNVSRTIKGKNAQKPKVPQLPMQEVFLSRMVWGSSCLSTNLNLNYVTQELHEAWSDFLALFERRVQPLRHWLKPEFLHPETSEVLFEQLLSHPNTLANFVNYFENHLPGMWWFIEEEKVTPAFQQLWIELVGPLEEAYKVLLGAYLTASRLCLNNKNNLY